MDEEDPARATGAPTTFARIRRAVFWGVLAALSLPLVTFATSGFPFSLLEFKHYLTELRELASEHVLLFFAGGLIEELLAARKALDSIRPALGSLKEQLPLVRKLTQSSLLMKVAGPILEQAAGIDTFAEKKRELACCLLSHCDSTMRVILSNDVWKRQGHLFEIVRGKISNLVPATTQPSRRVVSAYLMSLINPADWTEAHWEGYQSKLFAARRESAARDAQVDFKRIHVLHEPDTAMRDGWQNLMSVMVAEAIMGFYVRAMVLMPKDVSSLLEDPNVGYMVEGAHLYDCGVYQGVKNRFVVVADLDPYFMNGRKAVDSAIVSDDVGLLDILRRNFNLAWNCTKSKSLYHLLKARPRGPDRSISSANIASFVPGVKPASLVELQRVLSDVGKYPTKADFWTDFDKSTAKIMF
jgi:hypothetical protein